MKTILFWIAVLCCNSIFACDMCGCGPGSSMVGFIPKTTKWTILSRTQNQKYSLINNNNQQVPSSYFRTSILGMYRNSGHRLLLEVPYLVKSNKNQAPSKLSGIGDISVQYSKILWSKTDFSFSIGSGLVFPSGESTNIEMRSINPGSGNLQAIVGANVSYTKENSGIIININRISFLESFNEIQLGNTFSISLNTFKRINIKSHYFFVQFGLSHQNKRMDAIKYYLQKYTDFKVSNLDLGVSFLHNSFSIGSNLSIPILYNIGDNTIKPSPTIQFQLGYYLF